MYHSDYDHSPIPQQPEQDQHGDGDLPTYDDLTVQHEHIPNSRFGRWRSWIEKRAAERYVDTTREEFERRRARGWDLTDAPVIINEPASPLLGQPSDSQRLRVLTDFSGVPPLPPPKDETTPTSQFSHSSLLSPEKGLVVEHLKPSHLRLNHFGSRFIPHTTAPIRCILPLPAEELVLLGHDDGLSVLNMFPSEWNEHGLVSKGPGDAQARPVWEGEGVYQLSILEYEGVTDGTPQGVVLALVGTDGHSPRDCDASRHIRMYNLASLYSLAKWAVSSRGGRPLDLRRPHNWHPQETPPKKHGRHTSIARSLKSLILESPIAEKASRSFPTTPSQTLRPNSPTQSPSKSPSPLSMNKDLPRPMGSRENSNGSVDSASWDVVDDLPLRWATDFVPLAAPGSRLTNVSIVSYDLRLNDDKRIRGGAMLAVATKSNILLYETPKGERAFHFVKDFYTPLSPRKVAFVQQAVHGNAVSRMTSFDDSSSSWRGHSRNFSDPSSYPPQLSLFVIFDKKAGLIRIADSAVGEIELWSDSDTSGSLSSRDSQGRLATSPSANSMSGRGHRPRSSFDGSIRAKDLKGPWLLPISVELPNPASLSPTHALPTTEVYALTRGRQTHIVEAPLASNPGSRPPIRIFTWNTAPTHVAPRTGRLPVDQGSQPFLQLVAFSEEGLEVQEIPVSALGSSGNSAKGKGRADELVHADADVGGEAFFLVAGGHWQRSSAELGRSATVMSAVSAASFDTLDTEQLSQRRRIEQGLYGCVRKGLDDWRIFWVGGTGQEPTIQDKEY